MDQGLALEACAPQPYRIPPPPPDPPDPLPNPPPPQRGPLANGQLGGVVGVQTRGPAPLVVCGYPCYPSGFGFGVTEMV